MFLLRPRAVAGLALAVAATGLSFVAAASATPPAPAW